MITTKKCLQVLVKQGRGKPGVRGWVGGGGRSYGDEERKGRAARKRSIERRVE